MPPVPPVPTSMSYSLWFPKGETPFLIHYTPPSKCPVERSDVHRGPKVERYGQIFTGEFELRYEDIIIIGGELFLRGNNLSNFSPGCACLQTRFHF